MRRALPPRPLLGAASVALWVVLFALPGCILAGSNRDETVRVFREFNADLRWGRNELVLPRLQPALRARFSAQLQALGDDLEFLDEEMTALDVQRAQKGPDRAQARVELSWTSRRTGIVQRTTVIVHWETGGANWLVARLVRVRGAPLPLFDEPPAQKPAAAPEGAPAAAPAAPSEQPQREPEQREGGGGPR